MVSLDDIADINPDSLDANTPADYRFRYIELSSVERGQIDWRSVGEVDLAHAPSRARRLVRPGDVLFGTVRPTLQSHGAIPPNWRAGDLVASTGFSVIRARRGASDGRFLFHFILSDEVTSQARRAEVGSNYPAVNEVDVCRFKVPGMPIAEQRLVGQTLDVADEAIQGTKRLIAKLELMKEGLLDDLLTRGIDENGRLRDPAQHPHQFSDSILGPVPKGWDVVSLAAVGDWVSGGTPSKTVPAFWGGRVPWVTPKDMKSLWITTTTDNLTEKSAARLRVVPSNSVLVVVRGMILAHTFPVGLTASPMAFNQDIKGIVPVAIDGRFLAYWLLANSDRMLRLVTEATHGTKRIDTSELWRQLIARPPLPEQARIAEAVDSHERRIRRESELLGKLQLIRRGLANDLLTGRVRVTRLLEEGAA